MSRAAKMFGTNVAFAAKYPMDAVTEEGRPAFSRPLKERYTQMLLTNTFGNTYYVTAKDLVKRASETNDEMIKDDPLFAAKAIVFARNEGFMRTQPIYGLAKLFAANAKAAAKGLNLAISKTDMDSAFNATIRTPNDLSDFVTMYAALMGNKGGRHMKRVIGKWISKNLNEYWVIKYGAEKKDGYSIKDLVWLFHPEEMNPELAKYVMGKDGIEWSKIPQVTAFEALKIAQNPAEKASAIKEGRLPHEVATTFAGTDKEVWGAILPQMPVFALLRNLATLTRKGVIENFKKEITAKLSSAENVKKAKILPFRFYSAFEKVEEGWVRDALRGAIDNSADALPKVHGATQILLDVSGSMREYYATSGIMATSMYKMNEDTGLVVFGTSAGRHPMSRRDSILTQVDRLIAQAGKYGYGTNTTGAVNVLLNEKTKADNIILITDEQQNIGNPFFAQFNIWKARYNKNAKLFVINVTPCAGGIAPADVPGVYFLFGWGDQVINYVALMTQGLDGQMKAINDTTL